MIAKSHRRVQWVVSRSPYIRRWGNHFNDFEQPLDDSGTSVLCSSGHSVGEAWQTDAMLVWVMTLTVCARQT